MGDADGLPGTDRRMGHACRAGPRDLDDPTRNPGHAGHLPWSRAAGHQRRPGRPDERWPSRTGYRRRMVRGRTHRLRVRLSCHIRTDSTTSPTNWRSSTGCGAHPSARPSVTPAPFTASPTRQVYPNPSSNRCRSSSVAAAHPARRRWPPGTQLSTTSAFVSVDEFTKRKTRVEKACAAIERKGPSATRRRSSCVPAGPTPRWPAAPRPSASEPDELRQNGAAGSADETASTIRRFIDAGAERIYLQVLDLSDLDHLDFIANEVAPRLR